MKTALSILVNIAIPHLAGFIGSYFTISNIKSWYVHLNKPAFNPPNWFFSPVWLTLYTIIGVSFYLFHKDNSFKNKNIYYLYAVHIALNAIWSILFFGMHQIGLALLDLVLLIITLLVLMRYFYQLKYRASFYLMIPYLLWLCFACILNLSILILN